MSAAQRGQAGTWRWIAHWTPVGDLDLKATLRGLPDSELFAARTLRKMHADAGLPVLCGQQSGRWFQWRDGVYAPQKTTFAAGMAERFALEYDAVLDHVRQAVNCVVTIKLGTPQNDKDQEKFDAAIKAELEPWASRFKYRHRLWSEQGQAALIRQLGRTCGIDESLLDAGTGEIVLNNGRISYAQILSSARGPDGTVVRPPQVVLLPHDPAALVTRRMGKGVAYDPSATCPVFDRFMETSVADYGQRDWLLWRAANALFGRYPHKGFVNPIGETDSGKSTFTSIIARLAGGYAKSVDAKTFMVKHASDSGFLADELRGARFVSTHEPQPGARFDTGYLKAITGREDRQRTAGKWGKPIEWLPQCTVFIGTNRPILFDTSDEAMMRRQEAIRFARGYEKRDDSLAEKLAAELPGILNRLLSYVVREATHGKPHVPISMVLERESLADETEDALRFVGEQIEAGVLAADPEASLSNCVQVTWLYVQFENWCISEGIKERNVPGRKVFSSIVGRRYPARKSNGFRFHGLVANGQPGIG